MPMPVSTTPMTCRSNRSTAEANIGFDAAVVVGTKQHVEPAGCQPDLSRSGLGPVVALPDPDARLAVEAVGQQSREERWHVLGDEDRHGEGGRKEWDEGLESVGAPRADRDDGNPWPEGRTR